MSIEGRDYNQIFSNSETVYGKGNPDKIVTDLLNYRQSGTALELGAGQGRNALFLAEHGFKVTAQDMSETGINQMRQVAAEKGLEIGAEVSDVRDLKLAGNFDVLVSTLMLHHLSRAEAINLIKLMQEHTNLDGLNAITTFTPDGDFFRKNPNTDKFYPTETELKELYTDWEILQYQEDESHARRPKPEDPIKINTVARLLAKKRQ